MTRVDLGRKERKKRKATNFLEGLTHIHDPERNAHTLRTL